MEKTSSWASLYFIFLMTFGNYILMNLLVAIIVDGFVEVIYQKYIRIIFIILFKKNTYRKVLRLAADAKLRILVFCRLKISKFSINGYS